MDKRINSAVYVKQCMVFLFQIEAFLSLKNAWLPPIFFLDSKSTCYILVSSCISRHHPREIRVSVDAQNVCTVTKVGTILSAIMDP